jgi:CPA2 family monovalent cation:H+ antiporter-2
MPNWDILQDILIMLGAALLLGTIAERVGLSAILGYLVAGTLIGPNGLEYVSRSDNVQVIAELGVALLLFTIGLEFSFRRLKRLGRIALMGGSLQVVATLAIGAGAALVWGLDMRAAVSVGAIVALSSTACVLRLLTDRGVIDSVYGRNALGILLMQDLAVIPLMLLVVTMGGGGTAAETAVLLAQTIGLTLVLIAAFVVLFNFIVPRILNIEQWSRHRELPILLAIILALGSAYASHEAGLSPAIGAFLAGVLLGGSPFASQVRADVSSLRTVLVTIFFASIGMLGDPALLISDWYVVLAIVAMIIVGKTVIIWLVIRMMGMTHGLAVATGLCLAQVGEFSFVLAEMARRPDLITADVFKLLVAATIVTLFLTPFLVAAAPRVADMIEGWRRRGGGPVDDDGATGEDDDDHRIFVIGFGPAGQSVAQALYRREKTRLAVIELNARNAATAQRFGLDVHIGDASHREILEHAGVASAAVVAITVPDPGTTRAIIHVCRQVAPQAAVIVRSRYHNRRWELELAGAREVVDEEEQVGRRIAALVRRHLPQLQEPQDKTNSTRSDTPT